MVFHGIDPGVCSETRPKIHFKNVCEIQNELCAPMLQLREFIWKTSMDCFQYRTCCNDYIVLGKMHLYVFLYIYIYCVLVGIIQSVYVEPKW